MSSCWMHDPAERPTFRQLLDRLQTIAPKSPRPTSLEPIAKTIDEPHLSIYGKTPNAPEGYVSPLSIQRVGSEKSETTYDSEM